MKDTIIIDAGRTDFHFICDIWYGKVDAQGTEEELRGVAVAQHEHLIKDALSEYMEEGRLPDTRIKDATEALLNVQTPDFKVLNICTAIYTVA